MAHTITLRGIARELGPGWYVERLGGNVYGVVNYGGRTVTIDGGQREAQGPAELEVCDDGALVLATSVRAAREVPLLVDSI